MMRAKEGLPNLREALMDLADGGVRELSIRIVERNEHSLDIEMKTATGERKKFHLYQDTALAHPENQWLGN